MSNYINEQYAICGHSKQEAAKEYVIFATDTHLIDPLYKTLGYKDIPFKKLHGGYKMKDTDTFIEEPSFFMETSEFWSFNKAYPDYLTNQESILLLGKYESLYPITGNRFDGEGRKAQLLYLNNVSNPINIGYFISVPKCEALSNEHGYTYDPLTDTYFIAKSFITLKDAASIERNEAREGFFS